MAYLQDPKLSAEIVLSSLPDEKSVPGMHELFKRAKGLGSALKEVTSALGVKPCGGCQKRAELLDKFVPFKNGQ